MLHEKNGTALSGKHTARVMVIDDEPIVRDVLGNILLREGYYVETAEDGLDALQRIRQGESFNLLITDLMMAQVDGIRVVREVKRLDPFVEVIVVTGYYTIEYAIEAIRLGAYDFISKPCEAKQLLGVIKKCLAVQKLKARYVRINELMSLFEVSKTVSAVTGKLSELLKIILMSAMDITRSRQGFVLLRDESCDHLSLRASQGLEDAGPLKELVASFRSMTGVSDFGAAIRCFTPVDPFLSVPLEVNGELLGFMCIARDGLSGMFTKRERTLMSILAEQTSIAIKNARLYRERQNKINDLNSAMKKLSLMQTQLIQTEKLAALGRFSSGIAHEVKNPLAIIMGGIEVLERRQSENDEETRLCLSKIKDSALRANTILMNLLRFARPSDLKLEGVAIQDLVEETLNLLKYRAPLNNITVETSYRQEGLLVRADRNQMQQVLFNILMNAQEALPQGGRITVTAARNMRSEVSASGACVLKIADNGVGITPENLQKLFEPFFTTKRDKKGTGLGLSMARMIVENHRGKLLLESSEGQGTTVTVVLPLEGEDADAKDRNAGG